MQKSTLTKSFKPLTSIRRIEDYNLPEIVNLSTTKIKVPERLRKKDISYTYVKDDNNDLKLTRTCWITQSLSHLLNAQRFSFGGELYNEENPSASLETYVNELILAKNYALNNVSKLIKDDVLKDRKGPGFMSFVQSNENVPVGSILITERTLNTFLIPHNKRWKNTSKVVVTRFPNLGPNTTIELDLIVKKAPDISYKENDLTKQLRIFLGENSDIIEDSEDLMDPVFIHPDILKDCLQGDGDGDTVYSVISQEQGIKFLDISLVRKPGNLSIFEEEISKSLIKASRYRNKTISDYLPQLFDQSPIGLATYAIKMRLYQVASSLKGTCEHPMYEAWMKISLWAINKIEFVMDIRKGDYTIEEIQENLNEISLWTQFIKKSKENGCWFARTVTNSEVSCIDEFIQKFDTLQQYVDTIFIQ